MRQRMDVAREAILSAGSLLHETFGREIGGEVEEKDRNDFVTETDRQSEKLIVGTLLRAFPDIPVLAEETTERPAGSTWWVIDPLDGTTNFIHGYPQIGCSIALVADGELAFGLVYDPLREELFEASAGEGALCNDRPIAVSGAVTLEESLLGTGFPFRAHRHIDDYLAAFRELFLSSRGVRRAGAAVLDLAHVAAGRLDGFFELHLKPWDMAAGALIVREAGGLVSDFFGGDGFLSGGNIVAGTPSVHRAILAVTGRHFTPESVASLATELPC